MFCTSVRKRKQRKPWKQKQQKEMKCFLFFQNSISRYTSNSSLPCPIFVPPQSHFTWQLSLTPPKSPWTNPPHQFTASSWQSKVNSSWQQQMQSTPLLLIFAKTQQNKKKTTNRILYNKKGESWLGVRWNYDETERSGVLMNVLPPFGLILNLFAHSVFDPRKQMGCFCLFICARAFFFFATSHLKNYWVTDAFGLVFSIQTFTCSWIWRALRVLLIIVLLFLFFSVLVIMDWMFFVLRRYLSSLS